MAKAKQKTRVAVDLRLVETPQLPLPSKKAAAPLVPQTEAQRCFLSSLRSNTLTIVRGSAGAGKTYVALGYAAELLRDHEIERIILTRPLIGVDGEESKIGALPGTLQEKLQFWAMPMVDVLIERLGKGAFDYFLQHDKIRIVPLAYLRGSSFNDCFIHCTEAQNTSPSQIKMLLTRVGENAQVVLDGDPQQSDLKKLNGLEDACARLEDMVDVGVVTFTRDDVVRSGFCQNVLARYEVA
jgi:phosphate starvation-inducible protein PhoH and related proteins